MTKFLKSDILTSNTITGEGFPSKNLFDDFTNRPFLEIKLSSLYGRSDQDYKRIKRTKKSSSLYNLNDYDPNYYSQDLETTSKEDFNSLDGFRVNILPFSDYRGETNKKLQTFNVTQNNEKFVIKVKKSYGSEGTVYFNGPEPNVFNDIDFLNIIRQ